LTDEKSNVIDLRDTDFKMRIFESISDRRDSVVINVKNVLYYFIDKGDYKLSNSAFNTDCGYDKVIFDMEYKGKAMTFTVTSVMMDYVYIINRLIFREGQYTLELKNKKSTGGSILISDEDIKKI
jgi:hypothetical protein